MNILASDLFEKDDKCVFKARISCCVNFQPLNKYLLFFRDKPNNYLYLYIRNIENSRFKPVFGTQYLFVFVLTGRE